MFATIFIPGPLDTLLWLIIIELLIFADPYSHGPGQDLKSVSCHLLNTPQNMKNTVNYVYSLTQIIIQKLVILVVFNFLPLAPLNV